MCGRATKVPDASVSSAAMPRWAWLCLHVAQTLNVLGLLLTLVGAVLSATGLRAKPLIADVRIQNIRLQMIEDRVRIRMMGYTTPPYSEAAVLRAKEQAEAGTQQDVDDFWEDVSSQLASSHRVEQRLISRGLLLIAVGSALQILGQFAG
jgi:hypothetical protein